MPFAPESLVDWQDVSYAWFFTCSLRSTDRLVHRLRQQLPLLTGSRSSSRLPILISRSTPVCIDLSPHLPPDSPQTLVGTWSGAYRAGLAIYRDGGARGLLQGHSATLLRIFPYAAIKFMAYDQWRPVWSIFTHAHILLISYSS